MIIVGINIEEAVVVTPTACAADGLGRRNVGRSDSIDKGSDRLFGVDAVRGGWR